MCVVYGKPPTQLILPPTQHIFYGVVYGTLPTQHVLPPTQHMFESVLLYGKPPTQHRIPPTFTCDHAKRPTTQIEIMVMQLIN